MGQILVKRLTAAQLEPVARMYTTNDAAADAMGLSSGSVFGREGVECPSQRKRRRKKESTYGVN